MKLPRRVSTLGGGGGSARGGSLRRTPSSPRFQRKLLDGAGAAAAAGERTPPPRALLVLTLVAGGAACSVVEAVMARLLTLDAAVPELALGVALYAALRLDPLTGGLVAFSVGYLGDLSSGSPRGLEATALVLVALLARTSTERLFVSGPAFVAGFAGVASLLKNGIVALLLRLVVRLRYPAWPDWLGFGEIVRLALLQATATALLAPVSFAWARRIHRRWVGPRSALVASFDGPLE